MNSKNNHSDAPTSLLHWLVVIAFFVNLATGLRIAADEQDAGLAGSVSAILPQGAIIPLHIWSAIALLAGSIGYVFFILRAKLGARLTMDKTRWQSLRHPDHASRWKSVNTLIYWLAFGFLLVAGITGILLYYYEGLLNYKLLADIHLIVAWSLLAYVVVHVLAQFMLGGMQQLLRILLPQKAYLQAGLAALLVTAGTAFALFSTTQLPNDQLRVHYKPLQPTLDGRANDAIWHNVRPVSVHTVRGANGIDGGSRVDIRATHDGEHFYTLFQWQDTSRSFKHLPLKKTARGWKVIQTEYGIQDEDSYYEDKFGVMLAHSSEIGGAGSTHLGKKPLANKPGSSGGRGLHYTTDGSIVDVWHWKAVRSGGDLMQQIDDNYFGPPREPKKSGRYTGGYWKDPKDGGGFAMNWEKYSDDIVTPKRLPKDPELLHQFRNMDATPSASDSVRMSMTMAETVPYSAALDTYPVGTIMPAVLVDGPFTGDRGNVSAVSHWENNQWTLEVKRRLDTGSEFDVALDGEHPVYLWVSAFDHAQTRHTRHLHPLEVVLDAKQGG